MVFAAWTWTWVLGTLGLLSALVVVIHLLRLRRRRREVVYLPLFDEALGDASAAKRIDWLRRLLALLLSLAIVAALVFALGDPRFERPDEGRSIVLLVDNSLSMSVSHQDQSRLDLAKEAARAWARTLGGDDRVAVVAMGDAPLPMSPLTSGVEVLDHAIDAIPQGTGGSDVRAALALAGDILTGRSRAEIVLFGDRAYEGAAIPEGTTVSGARVGERAENLSITAFATRRLPRDPSRASVLLRVENHGELARRARVELASSAGVIAAHDLELEPSEAKTLDLDDAPASESRLEARVSPLDEIPETLTADDVAHAAISPRPRLHVHVVSPGNLYLEAALLLDETLTVTDSKPGDPLPERDPDLFIFDRALPPSPARVPALYIAPPEADASGGAGTLPLRLGRELQGPYVEDDREPDPLLAGLRFGDVNIRTGRALVLSQGDTALGRFQGQTLLARGAREGTPFVVMGFAVEESDLPLRVTWPLFVLRVVDELSRRDAFHRPPHRAGEPLTVTLASRVAEATWTRPSGATTSIALRGGDAQLVPTEPGVHLVEADDARAEVVVQRVLSSESDLDVPAALSLGETALEPPSARERHPFARPLLYLLGLAALLLLAEHLAFHRRWIE